MNKVITHTDLDGTACALVAESVFGPCDVVFCAYDTIDNELRKILDSASKYNNIVVADVFTSDEALGREVCALPNSYVFDHHKGKDYLNEYDNCRFDENACAAYITAQELGAPSDVLRFTEVVDKMDRMQDSHPDFDLARKLNYIHEFYGQNLFMKKHGPTIKLTEFERENIIPAIEEKEHRNLNNYVKSAVRISYKGKPGLFFVANGPTALIARKIFNSVKNKSSLDFILVYVPMHSSCSFYAPDYNDVDVSVWAKELGGGGHKKASGFSVDKSSVKGIINKLFKRTSS